MIDVFLEEIKLTVEKLAGDQFFQIGYYNEANFLPGEYALVFCHTVEKLLFMYTRVRRYIQTTVTFLTTRVNNIDEYDLVKLKSILKYFTGTRHMKLNLMVY